jgi:hypothetical protein
VVTSLAVVVVLGAAAAASAAWLGHRTAPPSGAIRHGATTIPHPPTTLPSTLPTTAAPSAVASTAPGATTTVAAAGVVPPCTPVAVPGGAYAVGDSVMIDAEQALVHCVPGITVNASVSRQWADGESVLRQVMAPPTHPAVVVVGLGTNGPIATSDFDTMMSILKGASRVVFVTVHVDRTWQDANNGVLAAGVARYPAVAVLADWQALAAQNPGWFYSDGTHLPIGGPGAQALAGLVASKI